MDWRSSNFCNFEVVKRSHNIGKSSFWVSVSSPSEVVEGREAKGAYVNAASVVGDLEQLEAALLDQNLERGRTCVDCIFNQLLESMDRRHDDFACCDLIDHILIERLWTENQTPCLLRR